MATIPRILIVDDDSVMTHLISLMLQKRGYNIVGKIESGEEAILKSADLNPDLVIMDIKLSGDLDGIAAAYYIFQLFRFPIIFITGTDDEKLLDPAKYSQPYGIIFKPFSDIELSSNVNLALYNHHIRKNGLGNYPAGDPKKIMEMHEGVIFLDSCGRIVFFNTFAGWFINLPEKAILMKHWRDVMMFINDADNEQLKDPMAEVVSQMSVVTYDVNTTAIVTQDSKRRRAGISVRPIKDDNGKFLVALMAIREKPPI